MLARCVAMAVAIGLVLPGYAAHAACGKDTDCKGDRICVDGRCTAPAPSKASIQPDSAGAAEDKRWWSVGVSAVAGYRPTGATTTAVSGAGVNIAFEYGAFYAAIQFLPPWAFNDNISSLTIGAGRVFKPSAVAHIIVLATVGVTETVMQNPMEGNLISAWHEVRQFRTYDYLVLHPQVRFGSTLYLTTGPRLGIGTRRQHVGSNIVEESGATLSWTAQGGIRF